SRRPETRRYPGHRFLLDGDPQVLTKKWHRSRRNTRLSGPEGLGGGFSVALTSKAVRRGVWVAPLGARKPRTVSFGAGVVGPVRASGQVQAAADLTGLIHHSDRQWC